MINNICWKFRTFIPEIVIIFFCHIGLREKFVIVIDLTMPLRVSDKIELFKTLGFFPQKGKQSLQGME